jgi:hypothetical protein
MFYINKVTDYFSSTYKETQEVERLKSDVESSSLTDEASKKQLEEIRGLQERIDRVKQYRNYFNYSVALFSISSVGVLSAGYLEEDSPAKKTAGIIMTIVSGFLSVFAVSCHYGEDKDQLKDVYKQINAKYRALLDRAKKL